MKLNCVATIFLLALLYLPTPGMAQALFLLNIGTSDFALKGAEANRAAVTEVISGIAGQLHLTLNGEALSASASGKNFNCRNIRAALATVAPGPNDILMLVYSGHGARTREETSPLPELACNDPDEPHPQRLSLREVVRILMAKHARLTLVVADLCNFPLPPTRTPSVAALSTPETVAYRRLLVESAGTIVLDSSSPNELSWYDYDKGGRFTQQFIATLKYPPNGERASWDTFVAKVTQPITISNPAPPLGADGRPLIAPDKPVLQSPQALVRLTFSPQ